MPWPDGLRYLRPAVVVTGQHVCGCHTPVERVSLECIRSGPCVLGLLLGLHSHADSSGLLCHQVRPLLDPILNSNCQYSLQAMACSLPERTHVTAKESINRHMHSPRQ